MYQKREPIFIRNITPMHVGVGSDLGVVDLPIQREKHTGYPKIESSGIKGCIREYFEANIKNDDDWVDVHKLFGYDDKSLTKYYDKDGKLADAIEKKALFEEKKGQFAGAVGFSDARILFFPVKSAKGIYAYVTCLGVLKKFVEAVEICGCIEDNSFLNSIKDLVPLEQGDIYCNDEKLVLNDKVVLDEYVYKRVEGKNADVIFKKFANMLGLDEDRANHMAIVHDDEFADFVTMYTEVITRTKISNETGTVVDGALFTEEYLPSETIMYTLLLMTASFNAQENECMSLSQVEEKVNAKLKDEIVLQIGSGATIGKGIVKMKRGETL